MGVDIMSTGDSGDEYLLESPSGGPYMLPTRLVFSSNLESD